MTGVPSGGWREVYQALGVDPRRGGHGGDRGDGPAGEIQIFLVDEGRTEQI
jgi:hypothetical protein